MKKSLYLLAVLVLVALLVVPVAYAQEEGPVDEVVEVVEIGDEPFEEAGEAPVEEVEEAVEDVEDGEEEPGPLMAWASSLLFSRLCLPPLRLS